MTTYQSIVLNLDEIWLKGLNRKYYIKILRKNVKRTVAALYEHEFVYQTEGPKHILHTEAGFPEEVIVALSKIAGISSLSPARQVEVSSEIEDIFPALREELESFTELPKTFRVTTKRSNKQFPMKSMEVSRKVGGWVKAQFGLTPKMEKPELTVTLRIIENSIYISTRLVQAIGGLPVGTSGHMICMLSGGFDSPVASYMMSKRGADQTFVFFHAYPYVGEEVSEKIIALLKVLSEYQRFAKLFVVPFGEIQKKIADHCKPDYRTILFRKYMVKCANHLAGRLGAQAIITGDALSQVSSQTVENMAAMDIASELPILRPLIGFNKVEIINLSKKVGTHDISVLPHDDACSLFAPKHPVIRAEKAYCAEFGADLGFDELVSEAIEQSKVVYFNKAGVQNEAKPTDYFQ